METKLLELLLEVRKTFQNKTHCGGLDPEWYVGARSFPEGSGVTIEDGQVQLANLTKHYIFIRLPHRNNQWYLDAFETIKEIYEKYNGDKGARRYGRECKNLFGKTYYTPKYWLTITNLIDENQDMFLGFEVIVND